MAEKDLRINEQIRVREVRLIDDKGEQRGIVSTLEALRIAREAGLDLVEVAPQSVPPVCRLLNYGKYKFEQEKKVKDAKKRAKVTELKEIRMQPKIAEHDLDFKANHVREFLEDGNKVKVTIRFRGRELAAAELYRKGAAPIVIASGGTGSLSYADRREAPFMAEFLELMGVRRNAVVIEDKSRNTFENAVYSKAYLEKREGSGNAKPGRIILVTSAWHQRRASAIFRKAGIDFYPYSVDSLVAPFMLPSDLFPDAWALTRSTRILIEMAGFVAYRIMGRL